MKKLQIQDQDIKENVEETIQTNLSVEQKIKKVFKVREKQENLEKEEKESKAQEQQEMLDTILAKQRVKDEEIERKLQKELEALKDEAKWIKEKQEKGERKILEAKRCAEERIRLVEIAWKEKEKQEKLEKEEKERKAWKQEEMLDRILAKQKEKDEETKRKLQEEREALKDRIAKESSWQNKPDSISLTDGSKRTETKSTSSLRKEGASEKLEETPKKPSGPWKPAARLREKDTVEQPPRSLDSSITKSSWCERDDKERREDRRDDRRDNRRDDRRDRFPRDRYRQDDRERPDDRRNDRDRRGDDRRRADRPTERSRDNPWRTKEDDVRCGPPLPSRGKDSGSGWRRDAPKRDDVPRRGGDDRRDDRRDERRMPPTP